MAGTPTVKVMLVDDHEIVREGLREVLEGVGDFEVVGQAADGQMAVEMASDLQPDVVVMDLIMPVKNGIDACREIMEEFAVHQGPKLKPRWDVHLSGDVDQLGCAGEFLSSVLGE